MKISIIIIFAFIISINQTIAGIEEATSSVSKKHPYSVSKDSIVTNTFSISSLGCGSDAANMQKAILETKGVKQCIVNAQKGTAIIKYDPKKTTKEELVKIIENCSLCHDKNTKPFKVTEVK